MPAARTCIIPTSYHVAPDEVVTQKLRQALRRGGADPARVEHALTGRDFDGRGRGVYGWADPDLCIRMLVEAGFDTVTIASGMGLKPSTVTLRREKLRIGVRPRHSGDPAKGERWAKVPGFRNEVSTIGRVRGPYGLMHLSKAGRRARVALKPENGGSSQTVLVANLVHAVFNSRPLDTPARPRNGDPHDCRLVNLEEGQRPATGKKADKPWTEAQCRRLWRAGSIQEAARSTGHSVHQTRKMMTRLGVPLATEYVRRRGKVKPLHCRDMQSLQKAVEALERLEFSDRAINLGLRITSPGHGACVEEADIAREIAAALASDGWSDEDLVAAMGVAQSTISQYLKSAGQRASWPGSTKAGPIDYRESEVWRDLPGMPYQISDQGRVANLKDDLISQYVDASGRAKVGLRSSSGPSRVYLVARLVLAAFKPGLTAPYAAYLDGDPSNITPENLVPKRTASFPNTQRGDHALDQPAFEMILAQARALCPPTMEAHERDDISSAAVLAYMDGRARTVLAAYDLARRDYHRIMGTWSETSLDSPVDDGLTLLGLVNEEGEIDR